MSIWWGEQPAGAIRRARVGPLTLWLVPGPGDVRVVWRRDGDALAEHSDVADADREEVRGEEAVRIAGSGQIALRAALADRSVVVRPEVPLVLAASSTLSIFVSTPLWVQVLAAGAVVADIPSFRPSDTWYGPNPRVGALCYASRTAARLDAENLPRRPARAVTELVVANHGRTPLPLDRLRVPIPALGLHFDDHFSTDAVRVEADDGEVAKVTVERRASPLAPPRRHDAEGMLVRALQLVRGV